MSELTAARTLIQLAELPPLAKFAADAPAGGGMPTFDINKDQALVVGSNVVSFTAGVGADFRQAISDSALFAQLATLGKVGVNADPMTFTDYYLATLLKLGWMVQKRDTGEFTYKGSSFDVHEAVIGVITTFLAPIAGAAAAVIAVLKGLHEMNATAPFITLFNKQSVHEKIGHFQMTYVHEDPDQGLSAEVMAFALDADDSLTQVLFFRLTKKKTHLRRSLGTLSIDTAAITALHPNIAARIKDYRTSFIAEAVFGPVEA